MEAKLKFAFWKNTNGGYPQPFARISLNKKKFKRVFVATELGRRLERCKSAKISNKDFPGAVPATVMGYLDNATISNMYVCKEWLKRMGLEIDQTVYIKTTWNPQT